MKAADSEIPFASRLPLLSTLAAVIVIAGSALIFCGWALSVPALTRVVPVMVVMNAATALAFGLAGMALWNLALHNSPRVRIGLSIIVAAVGALKLADYLLGWGLHFDRLLFGSHIADPARYPLSEMAPNTALNFVLCGLALALADWQLREGPPPAHILMLAAGFIALLALVGYTYRVLVLYRLGSEMPMSLDSAVASVLISVGFFAVQRDRGFMRLVLSRTAGGTVSRRLLPAAILVPWALGACVLLGEKAQYFGREFGLAVFAVACILIFTVLIWWHARLLHRADLERTEAAARLHQTSANLQRSNTELQQFAYVASHDLFEPLRMITSYLQLLNERHAAHLDPQAKEFIGYAIDGAKRMHALIQDLLAYSRVELRGHPFQPTDCEHVVRAAVANLKVAIDETGATVTHEPLPRVKADPVQLTQVFQNLIGNAIKFHGPAQPRVHISASQNDGEFTFSIRDNGIGIAPKDFERLFIIFQRLHTRQEYPGTGIGLALCKKIIERHGGRIWVESSPGDGATFLFTLPLQPGG